MTDATPTDAIRESPADHPNDHIDVLCRTADGGTRTLRFDIAAPLTHTHADQTVEVARFRYERLENDEITTACDEALIRRAARFLFTEEGMHTEVSAEAPQMAAGVCRHVHIATCIDPRLGCIDSLLDEAPRDRVSADQRHAVIYTLLAHPDVTVTAGADADTPLPAEPVDYALRDADIPREEALAIRDAAPLATAD